MIMTNTQNKKTTLTVCFAFLLPLMVGCASMRKGANGTDEEGQPLVQLQGGEAASRQVMENISKPYISPLGEIPLDINSLTEQWIKYFSGRGRKYMEVYLERSSRYLPMMKNTLREYGLPEDLVYVALIESGFSPLAHSRANAVGYWQFIRGTGKRYGLMLDPFIDERRDPVLSTRAAAEYFKTLYNMFGSWHLALASYNVGENRVKRAVAKYATRDYWELLKHRRSLPKETKHYVAKFIAATLVAKNPERYGFTVINYQAPLTFETVNLANPVSMTKLAENMNVSVEELKLLNPKFRGDFVPMYRGGDTVIRVPMGKIEVARAAIPSSISAQPTVASSDFYFYRVRNGDSLSTIARKHRTSIATLIRMNNLSRKSLLRIGQRLRVPDRGGSYVTYEMPTEKSSSTQQPAQEEAAASNPETHVVRRGENLSLIAKKYGLPVGELIRLNKLTQRSVLSVGQVIKVKDELKPESDIKPVATQGARNGKNLRRAAAVAPVKIAHKKHVVKKGETLAAIAKKYRLTIGALAKKNAIRNESRLLAGTQLIIPRK